MTRDEAIRAVVDAAEDVVNDASATMPPSVKTIKASLITRLADTLNAYWQKEGEEE